MLYLLYIIIYVWIIVYMKIKLLILLLAMLIYPLYILAVSSSSNLIYYNEKILDNNSNQIVPELVFRFSLWTNSDYTTSDITPTWAINSGNSNFASYQEVQNVIWDSIWNYITAIWNTTPLPEIDPNKHKYLQVEIKRVWDADTTYKLVDIDSDVNNTNDRKKLESWMYSLNTIKNYLQQNYTIWTSSGQLALLGESWKFDSERIRNYVNETWFTLNYWDNSWDIILTFGKTLNEFLKWAWISERFELSSNLDISWSLTASSWAIISWKNVDDYFARIDWINASNIGFSGTWLTSTWVQGAIMEAYYRPASNIPFVATWGLSSTTVQGAIEELSSRYSTGQWSTELIHWDDVYWTKGCVMSNSSSWHENNGYIMTWTWRIITIGIVSDYYKHWTPGEYVISKNDNYGGYVPANKMTSISLTWTWTWSKSAYSLNPTPWPATLSFKPGDILRAYHVGDQNHEINIVIRIQYD